MVLVLVALAFPYDKKERWQPFSPAFGDGLHPVVPPASSGVLRPGLRVAGGP